MHKSNWFAIKKAIEAIKSCWSFEQLNTADRYCYLVVRECVSNESAWAVRNMFRLCIDKQKSYLKERLHAAH